MKILISGRAMNYLSGQPLYCYELARELRRVGHTVAIISNWDNPTPAAQEMAKQLSLAAIRCLDWNDTPIFYPSIIIASEADSSALLDRYPNVPAINIIHSEYPVERPIVSCPNIRAWVAIRPSIKETWESTTPGPWEIIYNGVDFERFSPKKRKPVGPEHIVVPCTRDPLREKFLQKMASLARENRRVSIVGKDFGVKFTPSSNLFLYDEMFNIEDIYAYATSVHGILLGRVNLEARAMNLPTYIWNPETLENHRWEINGTDFNNRHNIKNVADQIADLCYRFLKTSPL